MDRIKLTGVKNITLLNEEPKQGKEYLLALIVERISVENVDDEEPYKIHKMKVLRPEMLQEVGDTRVIKIVKGFTKSQILRQSILNYLRRSGQDDSEEAYGTYMDKIIKHVDEKE